jgi:hypothetical protein
MIRWADLIGLAGFAVVQVSTLLLFPSSADHMNWRYMLEGFALWFAGVASVVGWLLLRWWRWGASHPKGMTWIALRDCRHRFSRRRNDSYEVHVRRTRRFPPLSWTQALAATQICADHG